MKRTLLLVLLASTVLQAQTPAPLTYLGAFRLPSGLSNGEGFGFGGSALAHNPATNTLFVASRGQVAEITIPAPVIGEIASLNMAGYVQPFADPTEGRLVDIGTDGVSLNKLAVLGTRLCGTALIYYDASNAQRRSHFCRSRNLASKSFDGWSTVGEATKTGWVSGWLAPIPPAQQGVLGGDTITGNCCVPIVTRTSWGPSAFAITAAAIGQPTVPSIPLLFYPGDYPLGPWEGAGPLYGGTTTAAGAVFVGDRLWFFTRNGAGEFCYGHGTGNPSLHQTIAPDGAFYCFDPTSSDKGQHAFPYVAQILSYTVSDLADVKRGRALTWAPTPTVIPLPMPISNDLGGVTIDQQRGVIYLSELRADPDGYSYRALIHVLEVEHTPPPTTDPRIAALEAQIAAMKAEAQKVLDRIAPLKTQPAKYILDALRAIVK